MAKRQVADYSDAMTPPANPGRPKVNNSLKLRLDDMKTISPLTENQKKFFDAYKNGDYFMACLGSPGTGKTMISLYRALEEVMDKSTSYKRVVVVRSAVQTRDQGHLPGSLDEKMSVFQVPYIDICSMLFGRKDAWARLLEQDYVEFTSTTAIRGVTFDDAIVIVDECQSNSWHELNSIISRCGHQSKIIFCGDLKQNDLIKNKNDVSGLADFLKIARTMKEFTEITFTPDDIVRSSLVKSWIIACENFESR